MKEVGHENCHFGPSQVVERIGDAEIVFLNKTVITKEALEKCPNLKFISVIATGYNTVDVNGAM